MFSIIFERFECLQQLPHRMVFTFVNPLNKRYSQTISSIWLRFSITQKIGLVSKHTSNEVIDPIFGFRLVDVYIVCLYGNY